MQRNTFLSIDTKTGLIICLSEFRECFYLYARSGQINTMDELTVTMRSLAMSPTIAELRDYMKGKGGKMSFADFLDCMHTHSKKESIPRNGGQMADKCSNSFVLQLQSFADTHF